MTARPCQIGRLPPERATGRNDPLGCCCDIIDVEGQHPARTFYAGARDQFQGWTVFSAREGHDQDGYSGLIRPDPSPRPGRQFRQWQQHLTVESFLVETGETLGVGSLEFYLSELHLLRL